MKINFYTTETMIGLENTYYSINALPHNVSELEVDECYVFDGLAVIYRGEVGSKEELTKPGLYTLKGEKYIHLTEEEKEIYSAKHIRQFDVSNIIDEIINNGDMFTDPKDLEVIQNNAELTIPVMRESDDFLTKLVKQVIISKKINLKNYEHKIDKGNFTNMKLSLNTESRKMSVAYFRRWAEVLGFDFTVVIKDDNTDKMAPLEEELSYDSGVDSDYGKDGED